MNEERIQLCFHLSYPVFGREDHPGNVRCGVCGKVWRWDTHLLEWYLIFDPKVDKQEDFNPEKENVTAE